MKSERILSAAKQVAGAVGMFCVAAVQAQSGNVDPSFALVVNGPVMSVAAQPDGKLVVGGLFTQVNGTARPYLARLNIDGSLDTAFNLTAGPGQFVNHVAVSQGKVFVSAGDGIRRFSEDGALDWHYPMQVTAFAVDAQQRVVFGGRFVRVENEYHRNIARLTISGTLDAAFAPAIGCCAGDGVDSILASGDELLVGGVFQSVNGEPLAGNLARLHGDGSLAGSLAAAESAVLDMTAALDGKIYRITEHTLTRHLSNGAIDPAFSSPAPAGFDERFLTVAAHGSGVLVGGNFTFNAGGTRAYLARFLADGSLDATFSTQPNGAVRDIVVQADGSVILAGDFTEVDGESHVGVARITSPGASPSITTLATARSAGGLVVSWPATASNAKLESRELNGTTWSSVPVVPVTINGRCCVTNELSGAGRIYRLVQP